MPRHATRCLLIAAALAVSASGCVLVPQGNARLEEARAAHAGMRADPQVAAIASDDARRADEAMQRALEAWNTLQDPALVDHLAYMAKQRAVIAREKALLGAVQSPAQTRSFNTGARS